jgi:anti-sigma B factor antagonist
MRAMERGGTFSVSVERDVDAFVVAHLSGELDQSSADQAKEHLVQALEPERILVADLADLEFMDSSGLAVFVIVLRRAREIGGDVIIRNPNPRVLKLFAVSSLGSLFSLDDAAGASRSSGTTHLRVPRDRIVREELLSLLLGFENLLRWGDLTPQQVTLALRGEALADGTTDLELAQRVRDVLDRLGAAPPAPPSPDE